MANAEVKVARMFSVVFVLDLPYHISLPHDSFLGVKQGLYQLKKSIPRPITKKVQGIQRNSKKLQRRFLGQSCYCLCGNYPIL